MEGVIRINEAKDSPKGHKTKKTNGKFNDIISKGKKRQSYPCNRPWRPIGL
jgi:hypothetical protein